MLKIPAQLLQSIYSAETITILTGAGISAESGIPTFRAAQTGLWAKFDPEELATPSAFRRNPKLVWDWYTWRRALIAQKKPNSGHRALVELARKVSALHVVTQNVDGLHQAAGSQNVVELHGNIHHNHCMGCGEPASQWDKTQTPPTCPHCNNDYLRPSVVWFGESLSYDIINQAGIAAQQCDVLFSIGTSSLVYPAAILPQIAKENGAIIVEVNPNPTPLTASADFAFQFSAGQFLPALVAALG